MDQALVWLVSVFSSDLGLVINLTWVLMLALSGAAAAYAMAACGASRPSAWVGGLLFALSPYAVYRNLEHFMLVTYLVPFACAAAVLVATGAFEDGRWRVRWPVFAGCALLGLNYVYYAFFACVLLGAATLGAVVARRGRRTVTAGMLALALIIGLTAANLLPSLVAWGEDGKPVTIQDKVPAEAEVYGLKVRHLLSPIFEHTVAPLAQWNRIDAWGHFPLETENRSARLGIIASIGFLAGLVALFAWPRRTWTPRGLVTFSCGQMIVAGVLLGTIGGFGSMFNLFIAPDIRGYSRVAPFLSFFSLLAMVLIVEAMAPRRAVRMGLLGAIAVVGVWDQRHPFDGINAAAPAVGDEYRKLQQLVAEVELALPPGSRVLQLPFTIYLNDPGRVRMPVYDQLKPYLVSRHLHWSFPALSNQQFRWEQAAMRMPVDRLATQMAREGFAAIWVDSFGYEDGGAAVLAALGAAPGSRVAWRDERFTVIDLREVPPAASAIATDDAPATSGLPRCATGAPVVSFEHVGAVAGPYSEPTRVRRHRELRITGWLLPDEKSGVATGLDVAVDGTLHHAYIGFPRPDVAVNRGGAQYQDAGFVAVIPAAALTAGPHHVSLRAASVDGACYTETPPLTLVAR